MRNFNPQGSREPRLWQTAHICIAIDFNPQGSREPRLNCICINCLIGHISIHKALASLDYIQGRFGRPSFISIHKALASLDQTDTLNNISEKDFNPQGSREPRQGMQTIVYHSKAFQSTRLSRASTLNLHLLFLKQEFQSTRLSRASTYPLFLISSAIAISIHKALASLDGKNAQLFLHLCHIYMLHIIHLLQIVYQVEISSRNLIVFSGQL